VDQEQDEIVIYWRPDCVFCLDLLLRLKFTRLRYRKVDIRKDPDAGAFVRSVADGNETVPTVVVAGRALVNPSKRQLIEAVRAHAPHTLGTAR
jgi:mycoredoxin